MKNKTSFSSLILILLCTCTFSSFGQNCTNGNCPTLSDFEEVCFKSGYHYLPTVQSGSGPWEICFDATYDENCNGEQEGNSPSQPCPPFSTLCCITADAESPCVCLKIYVEPGKTIDETYCSNNITIKNGGQIIFAGSFSELVSLTAAGNITNNNGVIDDHNGPFPYRNSCDGSYHFYLLNP